MAAALTFGVVWCALAATLTGIYAYGRARRKRALRTYAARVRYSTEALTEARLRVAHRHQAALWQPLKDAA